MAYDVTCLYSTLKNISGKSMFFAFLPPHGRRLANNEEFTVFGDIRDQVGNSGPTRRTDRIKAFEDAIEAGNLVIVSTPSPILKDTVSGASKALKLTSGTLSVQDPCWLNSVSA